MAEPPGQDERNLRQAYSPKVVPAHRQTYSIPILQRPTTRIFHNSLIINLLIETPIIDTLLGKGYRKCVGFINHCKSTPYKISS